MKPFRATLWIVFNLALGLAAGVALGWWPLAAPAPVSAALGLAGALVGAGVGWWSQPAARRRIVWAGHGLILLSVALAAAIPLYRIGALTPPGETRSANFRRLWRALDYAYPYFREKGTDRDALDAAYAPQVAAAVADGDYWRIVAHMLAELNDGHTGLLSPSVRSGRRSFATCRPIGDAVVVDEVGKTARDAGLERGDVVLAVDGRPVEDALAALSPILRTGATPQHRRAKAAFSVLSTTSDALTVTVDGPAGVRRVMLT